MSERLDEEAVRPPRDQLHGGAPPSPREVKGRGEGDPGDHEVRPGVQRPLPGPRQLPPVRKGEKVRDGPLISVRSARADDVAEQMEVERDERERSRDGPPGREDPRQESDGQREADVVAEDVVIAAPPVEGPLGVPRQDLGNRPQAVHVGDDSRQGDEGPVAPVQGGGARDEPRDEQVGDRAQGVASTPTKGTAGAGSAPTVISHDSLMDSSTPVPPREEIPLRPAPTLVALLTLTVTLAPSAFAVQEQAAARLRGPIRDLDAGFTGYAKKISANGTIVGSGNSKNGAVRWAFISTGGKAKKFPHFHSTK